MKIMQFLKDRLSENSTRTVIAMIVAAVAGTKLAPEHQDMITNLLLGGLTLVAALWGQDKKS